MARKESGFSDDLTSCFQGETPEEVAGLAEALKEKAIRVDTPYDGESHKTKSLSRI